ncbi:MAG: hypothetical protein H6732_13845 [Alphaproteobacteria bacterium]|nr:hypothetical protein [Alphaproteobacteria bacterium]
MIRHVTPLVVVAAALAVQLGCGGGSAPPAGTATKEAGGEAAYPRDALVVAYQSDLGVLNPIVYETAADNYVLSNIMEPAMDSQFDCELTHTPRLFESWTWSDDGLEFKVKLREDITYDDGVKVTAKDVALAYELVRDPGVASPRSAYTEKMVDGYPKATGEFEVTFRYTKAGDRISLMSQAALGYLPSHVFGELTSEERTKLRGHPKSNDPLVSGPWRLKLHEKNTRFVLEPNGKYTGPVSLHPKLKRVVFSIIPEYATRLNSLINGDVDLMEGINIEDVDRIKSDHPDIRIYSRGYRTSDYLAWNTRLPQFADAEVRRALTMAIDIDDIMKKLIAGTDGTVYAKRSVSTVTPELCKVHADEVTPLPHDAEQAKAILASKGWTDSDGDGILDKDGKPFRFTLATNSGNKRRADASILMQAHLKRIGIDAQLEQRESNTFFEDLRERNFEAALAGWSAALFVDPSDVWSCETDEIKRPFNFTGFCNPEVDALIEKGLAMQDPDEAVAIWKQVQELIYRDQPYTFLWWREELVGLHSRFEHVGIDVLSLLSHLEQWEVPADKVKYTR